MEQKGIGKNFTGTAVVLGLGLAISSMSFNSTQVINSLSEVPSANYGILDEQLLNNASSTIQMETNNIYVSKVQRGLEAEATELFGQMREATVQEAESVSNYVRSISKDTGVNFIDLC